MKNSITVLFAAVGLVGAALIAVPESATSVIATEPFWQMQGASPAARDTEAVMQLRTATRTDGASMVVAAKN